MQVTGALFADHVSIGSDARLNVVGGVWDTYTVTSLPESAQLPLALLAQRAPDDDEVHLTIDVTQPDGSSLGTGNFPLPLGHLTAENLALTLTVPVEFVQAGRHVFLFSIGGTAQAALPLTVQESGS